MKFKTTLAAAAMVLAATVGAEAQDIDYARLGPYVGIGGTYAVENFDGRAGDFADDTVGLNLRGGYRLHPNVAAELLFEWYDDFGTDGIDAEAWSLMVNAKFYPWLGQVQPFASLGLGAVGADVKAFGIKVEEEEFAARLGGGIDFYATENIVVAFDMTYVIPAGDLEDYQFLAIGWGVQYRF